MSNPISTLPGAVVVYDGAPLLRTAGMTIADGGAALVVLVRDGAAWRVESADTIDTVGACDPHCPVVLDAEAWKQTHVIAFGIDVTKAEAFCAAGWDVRPPLWRDGRPANPTRVDEDAALSILADGWIDGPLGRCTTEIAHAARLAAWGTTHPTSASPPAPLRCAVTGNESGTDTWAAGRPCTCAACTEAVRRHAASPPAPSPDLATVTRQRDEAEAALTSIVERGHLRDCGIPSCNSVFCGAVRLLVARGLLPGGKDGA